MIKHYCLGLPISAQLSCLMRTLLIVDEMYDNFNEVVYNFLKSNSQIYNSTYKLHFTILDYGQNFEGGFQWKCIRLKSLAEHDNVDKFVQLTCSVRDFNLTLSSQTPFILHHKNTVCLLCSTEKRHMVKDCSFRVKWRMADIVDSLLKGAIFLMQHSRKKIQTELRQSDRPQTGLFEQTHKHTDATKRFISLAIALCLI